MYKVITEEHLQFIKEHSDLTDIEIGKILGINCYTIRGARQKLGIFKENKINISKEDFLDMYEKCGHRLNLLAKQANISRTTLRKIAKKYGIKTDHLLDMSDADIRNICNNYNNNTASELAEKYNCSASKISQVWAENGLRGKIAREYHLDENYFTSIDTPAKAYYVGLIASDGCLYATDKINKSSIIRISISAKDAKVLEVFQNELHTNKPIYYHTANKCDYATLEICSNKLVDSLVNIGMTPVRKTYGNTIPIISDHLMPHFIRGYFDGDGSVPYKWDTFDNNKMPKIQASISGYKKNLEKIIDYLYTKNIYAAFVKDKRHYNGDGKFGSMSLSNLTSVYCFLKFIYDDCSKYYMDRKKIIADNIIKHIEDNDAIRYKQIVTYYKYAVQAMH